MTFEWSSIEWKHLKWKSKYKWDKYPLEIAQTEGNEIAQMIQDVPIKCTLIFSGKN